MNDTNKGRLETGYEIVGLLGALATIPQVIKVWTSHPDHLQGLSFITWFSYALICGLAITYGMVFKRKAIVVANIAYLAFYVAILVGMLVEAKSLW